MAPIVTKVRQTQCYMENFDGCHTNIKQMPCIFNILAICDDYDNTINRPNRGTVVSCSSNVCLLKCDDGLVFENTGDQYRNYTCDGQLWRPTNNTRCIGKQLYFYMVQRPIMLILISINRYIYWFMCIETTIMDIQRDL